MTIKFKKVYPTTINEPIDTNSDTCEIEKELGIRIVRSNSWHNGENWVLYFLVEKESLSHEDLLALTLKYIYVDG